MRLGDIVKIKTGKLNANATSPDGKYPFFTCAREISRISTYSYDCECVLVAGNGDLNVKYYKGKFDAYQRTYIIEDNSNGKLLMPYLYFFLDKYVETLREKSIGGVIKYIKLENLTEANIPLPSIDKQQDIVNCLSIVNNIKSKCNQELSKLDELVKSRFVEMFGDLPLYSNMQEVCKIITDGTHQPPKFVSTGIPFIFVSNIVNDCLTYNAEKFISEDTYNDLVKRTPIEIGDLLLSTVGSYGHPAIVESERKFLFQRHIAYLKPDHSKINSRYLHAMILSDAVQRQIESKVKGIAQKTLNLSEIKSLRIPLPKMELQNQFADFVQLADKSKLVAKALLAKCELLREKLMQDYFC